MRWLRRYRLLLIVAGFGFVAAQWELTSPDPEADVVPRGYPATMTELYPDAPEYIYFRGIEAMYGKGDLVEAREHFERALATGVKTHEELLHAYAIDLVLLEADRAEIDAAVANWRENFPDSDLPDPREFRGRLLDRTRTLERRTYP